MYRYYRYVVQFFDYENKIWVDMDSFLSLHDAEFYVESEKRIDYSHDSHFIYRILKVVEFYD